MIFNEESFSVDLDFKLEMTSEDNEFEDVDGFVDEDEVDEDESVEYLKAKIERLEKFILESDTTDEIAHESLETEESRKKISAMELKIKLLTEDLNTQKTKFHNAELKSRLTLQQKLVETKAAADREIIEFKNSVRVLQSKVYNLQEELQEKSPVKATLLDESIYSNSDLDELTDKILKMQERIEELEGQLHSGTSSTNQSLPDHDVDKLQSEIFDLKSANEVLKREKIAVENRLDLALSEISELESIRSSPMRTPLQPVHSPSRALFDSPIPYNYQNQELLFVGLVKRKQTSLPGRWLPRLILMTIKTFDFWIPSRNLDKDFEKTKSSVQDAVVEDRGKILTSLGCTFRVRGLSCE